MTEKGISVFRYYLPVDFKVEKNFLNPFYKDTKASCNIYYERKAGVFKMKGFGNEDYSGDCFELTVRLLIRYRFQRPVYASLCLPGDRKSTRLNSSHRT